MNRRTFLKAVGVAMVAPGAVLGAVKTAPAMVSGRAVMLKHPGAINPAFGNGIGRWDGITIREQARREFYEWARKKTDEDFVATLKSL